MRKFLLVFSLLAFTAIYSQIFIPASSAKGKIVTVTNQTIEYSNLKYDKGKVSYYNLFTNTNEFLYDNSIKSIQYAEADGSVKYSGAEEIPPTVNQPETTLNQKLTNDKEIKNYLLQNNDSLYMSGEKPIQQGTYFLPVVRPAS